MLPRPAHAKLRTTLALVGWAAAAACVAWVTLGYVRGWHRQLHSVEDSTVRVMLTLIGVAVTAAVARLLVTATRVYPRGAAAGLGALALSGACYALLVWTHWKVHPTLWRVWWVTLIGTVTATHLMLLRLPHTGRRGPVERVATRAALLTALLLALLAFRKDVLLTPAPWYLWATGAAGAVATIGTFVGWVRVRRANPPPPFVTRWQKVGWTVGGLAGMFLLGLYVGRVTAPAATLLDVPNSAALAALPPAELDAQLDADLRRLKVLAAGMDDLRLRAKAFHDDPAGRAATGRTYYTPDEELKLRAMFRTYLAYRDALLRMVATYGGFRAVHDPARQARCFLVGYGAGATLYGTALDLVGGYGDDPIRRKLNEPDAAWNLPAGKFDEILASVTSDRVAATFTEMAAWYAARREQWAAASVLPADDLAWLRDRIDHETAEARAHGIDRDRSRFDQLLRRVKSDAYDPVYNVQSLVSTWIGDTRLVGRPSFISHAQVKSIQPRLRPGDILLERRNWFASNAFLPGFWPHAALYLGTADELAALGLLRRGADGKWTATDPAVAAHLDDYLRPAADGEAHTVVESVSEGVIFNSLTESMGADYIAVLRPRLTDAQKAAALARAFSQVGKPYDFEFDFSSSDKLVCTELVYQSYDGLLHLDGYMQQIVGRPAIPALQFCRKFASERGTPGQELDFVLFLDAVPDKGTARLAGEDDFCASADRPRGFNE
jgi:hypothetical protein